jgi:sodium transport system permease protein
MILSMGVLLHFFGSSSAATWPSWCAASAGRPGHGGADAGADRRHLRRLLLSISVYAKSYKEAAGLISPLILFAILPTVWPCCPASS